MRIFMNNQEVLQKYLNECGLSVVVEKSTVFLSVPSACRLENMNEKIDFHFNVDYLCEFYNEKKECDYNIYSGGGAVVITDSDNGVVVFVPIYEFHCLKRNGNIISVTGHEQTATIVLNDIMNSFVYYTR